MVIALASRSVIVVVEGSEKRGQVSQWAFGSQGFESLPRRHLFISIARTMTTNMAMRLVSRGSVLHKDAEVEIGATWNVDCRFIML